jgi:hypothetical protein
MGLYLYSPFFLSLMKPNRMFQLFRKKAPSIKYNDKIWLDEKTRFRALLEACRNDNQLWVVCWFDETLRRLQSFFSANAHATDNLVTARELKTLHMDGDRKIHFAEHYPLREKEEAVFEELKLKEVTIYSSLDEPLFTSFGGERIAGLIKKLGMDETESIEHPMISKSIQNAQEKISKKISFEQSAPSQDEWFIKNFAR